MRAMEGNGGVEDDDDCSPSFHHPATDKALLPPSTQNRMRLGNAAFQTLRYSVSAEASAAIVTGSYIDAGIITDEDKSKVVIKCKMQNEIDRCLEKFEVSKLYCFQGSYHSRATISSLSFAVCLSVSLCLSVSPSLSFCIRHCTFSIHHFTNWSSPNIKLILAV